MKFSLLFLAMLLLSSNWCNGMSRMDFEEFKANITYEYNKLVKHMMGQHILMEQRARTEGTSGFKAVRGDGGGPENYFSNAHIGYSFNQIHDHANYKGTLGMAESVAVMNGVEFQTRHNDYKAVMPDKDSKLFHKTVPIPFPEVPPEVASLPVVADQVQEMRQWFKAFVDQNYTVRDYRKYFKPILCYFEGAWTMSNDYVKEPFSSTRHFVNAKTWSGLQKKIMYTAYSGMKDPNENLAFLPPGYVGIDNTTGLPNLAQWNYRILCYPTPMDIPIKYLRQVDDMSYRVPRKKSFQNMYRERGVRFKLSGQDRDEPTDWSILDEIFSVIPGVDNNPEDLSEIGDPMYKVNKPGNVSLNTGYYHRWYRLANRGDSISNRTARGFNDEFLFVAQTTNENIAPVEKEICTDEEKDGAVTRVCKTYPTRFTYAMPLELIYMTPLMGWNPYDLEYRTDFGLTSRRGSRGGANEDKAFNGTFDKAYYINPAEIFSGYAGAKNPADTTKKYRWVLDKHNIPQKVTASGPRILTPNIAGVGEVKLRYPIGPVHQEDSAFWKDLNAFRDKMMKGYNNPQQVIFQMGVSPIEGNRHTHWFFLTYEDYCAIKFEGLTMKVKTSINNGHSHDLQIKFEWKWKKLRYTKCDKKKFCKDRHQLTFLEAGRL